MTACALEFVSRRKALQVTFPELYFRQVMTVIRRQLLLLSSDEHIYSTGDRQRSQGSRPSSAGMADGPPQPPPPYLEGRLCLVPP